MDPVTVALAIVVLAIVVLALVATLEPTRDEDEL